MTDEVKLLGCPHCGTSIIGLGKPITGGGWLVECECGAEMCCDTQVEAIMAWNRRFTHAPAPREDGWRLIKTQPPTEADGLFLAFVPSCIMGCALVESGKIVWPREGESEQAHGVTHWRPLPSSPSAREG